MKKKPNLVIYYQLIEPIFEAIRELDNIREHYQVSWATEDYIHKGTFAYIVALLEGSISETAERFLVAFPEKLPKAKLEYERHKNDFLTANFSHDVIKVLAQEYIAEFSYQGFEQQIEKFCTLFGIDNLSKDFGKSLKEKKARRNILIHNNLKIDSSYIRATGCDPDRKGDYCLISQEYVLESISDVRQLLEKFQIQLGARYQSYTILKAVKDVWAYVFDSPLLAFDDYWGVTEDGTSLNIKGDALRKQYSHLSSGEKTLLFYFLQNYSTNVMEIIGGPTVLNMQISNNEKMVFLVSVFDRFPLLLQNLNSIEVYNKNRYIKS